MKKKMNFMNYVAVLSVFFFAGAGTFMNAAMEVIMSAFPDLSASTVRLVVTLPPLASLPVMLVIGGIVGKKLSYRFCAIFGTLLIAAGGVAPFFLNSNFNMIIFFRALVGIGVGFLGIRNPLLVGSVPENRQTQFIGYGTVIWTLGATVASPVVGYFATISWRHAFLFDAFAFIPVILMLFFLREPENGGETIQESTDIPKEKGKFNWRMYFYIGMMLVFCFAVYPLLSALTTYMADKNIGNAVVAGTILSSYTLAGVLSNLILDKIQNLLKKKTVAVLCLMVVIGIAFTLFMPSIPTLFAGVFIAGVGFNTYFSIMQVYNAQVAPPAAMASGSTWLLVMLQLGIFLSTYFISICHGILHRSSDAESSYIVALIIFIIMTVVCFVLPIAPPDKDDN